MNIGTTIIIVLLGLSVNFGYYQGMFPNCNTLELIMFNLIAINLIITLDND